MNMGWRIMNSTLAFIVNVPTLCLLYILTYFTQALSGKRQFYGISLNYDYFKKEQFKTLDKKYKLYMLILAENRDLYRR